MPRTPARCDDDPSRASDYAALVRVPELTLITTITVGDDPGWSETALDGSVCLVSNSRSDDLSIISIAERREIVRLPMGNGPKHITVAHLPASVTVAIKERRASRSLMFRCRSDRRVRV